MAIRFYIDADLLGVARILADARSDVTYPGGRGLDGFGRPPCPIQPGDKDVDWIPRVARAGWIVISHPTTPSGTIHPPRRQRQDVPPRCPPRADEACPARLETRRSIYHCRPWL